MEATMRRTAWILAALGIAGTSLRPCLGDDAAWPRPAAARSSALSPLDATDVAPSAFERAARKKAAASTASKKNYGEQLFGASAEADLPTTAGAARTKGLVSPRTLREEASRTAELEEADAPIASSAAARAAAAKEAASSPDEFKKAMAAEDGLGEESAVIQAENERLEGELESDSILPVGEARPFPAAQRSAVPARTPARPAAARQTVQSAAQPALSSESPFDPQPEAAGNSLTDDIAIDGAAPQQPIVEDLPEIDFSDSAEAQESPIAEAPVAAPRQPPAKPNARKVILRPQVNNEARPAGPTAADFGSAAAAAAARTPKASPTQSKTKAPAGRIAQPEVPVSTATDSDARTPVLATGMRARARREMVEQSPIGMAPAAAPAMAPAAQVATSKSSRSAGVTAEWVKKSEITIGQECTCDLVVTNHTESDVAEVEVEAHLPKNVELVSTDPAPASSAPLIWKIDTLGPGQSKSIAIHMVPRQRGNLATQALVRFSNTATKTFSVAEPMLTLDMSGPTEVMVGDPASQTVTIRNPGTGVAANVKVEAHIPNGLEHSRGTRLVMDLGSLNPGESRPVRLALAAVAGGHHVVEVKARADGGLIQTAASEVVVISPKLNAAIHGPGLRYLGRQAVYTLSVSNDGQGATDNVRVMHKIPEGFEFIACDKGGRFDASSRLLSWFVGPLGRGEAAEAQVTLKAQELGDYTHFIRATSEHGIVSDAQVSTTIEGASALAVHITDLDDPVEVGVEAAYEIKVINEGSAPAESVVLACDLADGTSFMSATGPVSFAAKGQVLEFRPITALAPGETAKFQVFVRGEKAGNMRFKTRLNSASISDPLISEELTKFYGE
jgi:uncharacterized repeat protein (TIGR01451 family)